MIDRPTFDKDNLSSSHHSPKKEREAVKKYGFTSSTGLWDEYQEWLEGTKGTESLGSAARGLWNIIRQLGDSPATAQKRIESYASDGRITEEEEAILLRMVLALAGE